MTPEGLPPAPRKRPRWLYALGVVVVLALIAAVIPPVRRAAICRVTDRPCEADLTKVGSGDRAEWVGVLDSSPPRAAFAKLMAQVRAENAYATEGGPGTYVTVAVAGPLTDDEPRALHRLEGAVAGQHDANHGGMVGDKPRIRLVLANMDHVEGHWKQVTDELVRMNHSDDHLVAIAGIGLSQAESVDAMNELRKVQVPVIGDVITADTINARTQPGFIRVGPDTGQQVDVLGQYFRRRLAGHRAMIVAFTKQTDLYTSALKSDFQRYLGGPFRAGGSVVAGFGESPGNEFPQIVKILCGSAGIDTIFYAGRAADLPQFLTDLSTNRGGCASGKVTVVSTSDTSRLLAPTKVNRDAVAALTDPRNKTELIYTPLADEQRLAKGELSAKPYANLGGLFGRLGFDPVDLRTGWAVMAHDAVLTAAQAVHNAAGNGGVPPAGTVTSMLGLMQTSTTSVPGASGPLRIDPRTGDQIGLRIPVLRFTKGAPKELGVYSPSYP